MSQPGFRPKEPTDFLIEVNFAHFGFEIKIFGCKTELNQRFDAIFAVDDPEYPPYFDTWFETLPFEILKSGVRVGTPWGRAGFLLEKELHLTI